MLKALIAHWRNRPGSAAVGVVSLLVTLSLVLAWLPLSTGQDAQAESLVTSQATSPSRTSLTLEWIAMSSGTPDWLYDVWSISPSDVFAVGLDSEHGDDMYPAIHHYDGSSWSAMTTSTTKYLAGVWGSSSSDVFAVGDYGSIVHYNGSSWSAMNSGTTLWLTGVWGNSSSDVFAVGASGTILHYDGDEWSTMTTGITNSLYDAWGTSATDVFAVGDSGGIFHYDGSTWNAMSTGTTEWFSAIWGNSSDDVFAVGGVGTILHYDGSTWSTMASGTTYGLLGVWGSSSDDVFASGDWGTALHYDGSTWSAMTSGTFVPLQGIHGSSSNVFAVGGNGTILHCSEMPSDPPTVTSVTPNQGSRGQELTVTITGTNLADATVVGFGAGIAVDGFAVDNATQVTADITISDTAAVGPRDVTVTTPASTGTLPGGFTVNLGGWAWQNPLPQGNTLRGIWGSSSSDVFAVGDAGTILHYDGIAWSGMVVDNTCALFGVWGSSSDSVFAVGQQGTILHYNGTDWEAMPSGLSSSYTLYDIWGSSPSDVFAVGSYGTVLHYNGISWSSMTSGTGYDVHGIWGSSATDVFAAVESNIVLHYDGSSWSSMETNIPVTFVSGVWGSSSSDVWISLLHYDGSTWSRAEYYPSEAPGDVWGSSSSDVYGVGNQGSIHHYDGDAWSAVDSNTTADLLSVWGSSSSDVFAVGSSGTILHYNGIAWSAVTGGTGSWLAAVWGSSSSDVFAVGGDMNSYPHTYTILHHDGITWSSMTSGTTSCLLDIWGSSADDVFAVGSLGTILHYNGASWSTMTTDLSYPYDLHAVWGSSASDVFAVGNEGLILHFDGDSWSTMRGNGGAQLRAVWGTSPTNVYAMGGGYREYMFHYDGSAWEAMESGPSPWVQDIWGTSPTNVYAVCDYGASGDVFHFDGTSWSAVTDRVSNSLYGIWGSSATDIFAVGGQWDGAVYQSTILHWDGTDLTMMETRAATVLWGVWGSSASDVFAAGLGGAILHYPEAAQVNQAPEHPDNLSPASGATGVSLTPTLQSSAFSDPDDGDTHAASQWQISQSSGNYTAPVLDRVEVAGTLTAYTLTQPDALSYFATYYWHVRYRDDHGAWSDWSAETSFTTLPPAPSVTTGEASNITAKSAKLNGELTSLGSAGSVTVSFVWGTSPSSYTSETTGLVMTDTGAFSFDLGSLTPSTTFYYKAKAAGDGTSYGAENSFTTLPPSPLVTTGNAGNITTNSAKLNGELTSLGTASSVTVTFVWGTSPGLYTSETTGQVMTDTGAFSFDLGSLMPGTTYYYKAKAAGDGISYGAESSFHIPTAPPAATTGDVTDITTSSARLNGNLVSLGSASSVTVSFVWGTASGGPYPNETTGRVMTETGTFSFDLISLSPGTTYYCKAKAVGDGITYGNEMSVVTHVAPPAVTTNDASSIAIDRARLNGELTSRGSASSVLVSFVWGTTPGGPYPNETAGQWMAGTGACSFGLNGLTPGTTYYYKAKAVGDRDPVYGDEKSFTTGQSPVVEEVDPETGKRGKHLTVIIRGANFDGVASVSFGPGITVADFEVSSSTEIRAEIDIDGDADMGDRDISVTTGWDTGTKAGGFSVERGGGGLCSRASGETRSEMTPILAALGLALGTGYWFARKGSRRSSE